MRTNLFKKIFLIFLSTLAIVACGGGETRKLTTEEIIYNPKDKARLSQMEEGGEFFADLMGRRDSDEESFSGMVSIKSPLWKASLDVLSSFPLSSVDSKSGLIITDWYTSEKKPTERFKITVLLLSQQISSDSLKVSVHRQIIKQNRWVNKNIDSKKLIAIERKIIQKAIELNL